MVEKTEDLKLPMAVVTRLIKDALPDGVIVSKEAKTAIARAASVFVLHTTSFANQSALDAKRKTINAQDVLAGVRELECDELVAPVSLALDAWKEQQSAKKKQAAEKPKLTNVDPEVEAHDGDGPGLLESGAAKEDESAMPETMPQIVPEEPTSKRAKGGDGD